MLGRVRLLTLMLVQNKAQCDLEKETAEMMIQCTICQELDGSGLLGVSDTVVL